jgi:outer membrane receptor protein involved in Fe transport
LLYDPTPQIVNAVVVPAGAKLPLVPKHTFNVGVDYSIQLGDDASVNLHADGAYKTSSPASIDPTSAYYWKIPASFIANARVSYNSGNA